VPTALHSKIRHKPQSTRYDEVEKLWEENYRTLPVPEEYGSDTRSNCVITADTKYVEETSALLSATDRENPAGSSKRVAILPMLYWVDSQRRKFIVS